MPCCLLPWPGGCHQLTPWEARTAPRSSGNCSSSAVGPRQPISLVSSAETASGCRHCSLRCSPTGKAFPALESGVWGGPAAARALERQSVLK